MCPKDDSHLTLEFEDHFVIRPAIQFTGHVDFTTSGSGEIGHPVEQDFEFHSGRNPKFLSQEEILAINGDAGV